MADFPCCHSIKCPGVDQSNLDFDGPLANLTSERPDTNPFVGLSYGWDFNFPPLGSNWTANSCLGLCESLISQEDSDLCAARNNLICLINSGWGTPPGILPNGGPRDGGGPIIPPPPGDTPVLFFNQSQSCTALCPDGTPFVWTVNAGTFVASTLQQANAMAFSFACQRAAQNIVCLGGNPPPGCINVPYDQTIALTGGVAPITTQIVSGSLPPGLFPSDAINGRGFHIFGTPTAAGNYTFTLKATDARGSFNQHTYTLSIIGISNLPVPDGMENTPYSYQLQGTGGTAPYTFQIVNGSFGPDLSLSSSGLISGTPAYATARANPFIATVTIKDATNKACSQDISLKINLRPGPDWTQLVWTQYVLNSTPGKSTCFGSAAGNVATGQLENTNLTGSNAEFAKISPVAAGGVSYTGGAITARMRITVSGVTGFNTVGFSVSRNGVQIGVRSGAIANGVTDVDFAVNASVGAAMTVEDIPGTPWANVIGVGNPGTLNFVFQIFNL